MNRFLIIFGATLLALATTNADDQDPSFLGEYDFPEAERMSCFMYQDLTYFDYSGLYKKSGYTCGNYSLNFCKSISFVGTDNATVHAYAYKNESGIVTVYAEGGDLTPDTIEVYDLDGVRNVRYSFDSGSICETDTSKTLSTTFEIICNDEDIDEGLDDLTVEEGNCKITIKGSHKHACAEFQATAIVDFFSEYPWILGIILIVFGTITLFFGGKFFPYVIAAIAGGITFFIVLVFASVIGLLNAFDIKSEASRGEIALAILTFIIATTLAMVVGWFSKKFRKIGGTISAATCGFLVGLMLYYALLISLKINFVLIMILLLGLAIFAGYISWKYDQTILVYTTAIIGAYALFRGISLFAGDFPNEINTYQELMAGKFVLSNVFYIYLISIAATTAVGITVQRKLGYLEQKDDGQYNKIN